MKKRSKILGGAIGECIHIAGISHFLDLAGKLGYETIFLGPASSIEKFISAMHEENPDIVAVSYRLTPELAGTLLKEFKQACERENLLDKRFVFGGTPPVIEEARKIGLFEEFFSENDPLDKVYRWLEQLPETAGKDETDFFPQTLVERIKFKAPFPLLRHHYGVPAESIKPTVDGICHIAESRAIDIISLGPDQDAQENFFHPEKQNPNRKGAGGVPFRSEEELFQLYRASQRGNFPLMRSYSGTSGHIKYADMLNRTIHNAWCATSLFWFNAMDGRGPSPLEKSIAEHIELMKWHGSRNIPIEGNEPYHWSLRDGHDVMVCASSYIYAYAAKKMGVKDYILSCMFETPRFLSNRMDLAKALAKIELAAPLADNSFRIIRQTRTGLYSYPTDVASARAHLASSIYMQLALNPSIIHVVGYAEADHAVNADELIESCKMADWVIKKAIEGIPDMTADPVIIERKNELICETHVLIDAIVELGHRMGVDDPLISPVVLTRAVKIGLLDAPQLRGNRFASGEIRTCPINGAIYAVDERNNPISEETRTDKIMRDIE